MAADGAPPFALGTFSRDGERFSGLVIEERVHDLRPALGDGVTTRALLEDWEQGFARLGAFAAGDLGSGTPVPYVFPALAGSLSGAYDDVVLFGPGTDHDWELELAVVIGKPAWRVPRERAMDHVAAYTISNDVSTRDVMHRPNFPMTDFMATKIRPTFFPTGPYLVPAAFVPDPYDLRVTLTVNGEVMQDESTADIIFGIDQLVAYASTLIVLRPGDLLLTGSPAGNAAHRGNRWLRPGDVMEGEITGLGVQRNVCVEESAFRPAGV